MIIASNRLPVSIVHADGLGSLRPSSGGLASALQHVHGLDQSLWVGWLGDTGSADPASAHRLNAEASALRLKHVPLSTSDVALYYDGYSNAVLWPLFHYLLDKVRLEATKEWRAYIDVNRRFADAIAAETRPYDTVWIHDYQLALVPAMLRQRAPAVRIGFFLHVPWPSADVFRILPSRNRLLTGMLGADLLGFQTDNDRQNFLYSAAEVLDLDLGTDSLRWEDRDVRVGVYPIGVDFESFNRSSPEIDAEVQRIRSGTAGKKIVLGVDRLDYTKGLPRRLLAINHLLEREPALRDKLHYIQLAVPTREKIDAYAELRRTVNELVARINSHHGSPTSSPVQLLYRSVSSEQLVALYRAADVMLVTPLRDGMNLVAKEYVAARTDHLGSLVLSEFAGAAAELASAISVNPYDVVALATAVRRAMFMPQDEQRMRMSELRASVENQHVHKWASSFLRDLRGTTPSMLPPKTMSNDLDSAVEQLNLASHRALLLDYDGTLVPMAELPSLAAPDAALLELLGKLAKTLHTSVHIITGRSREAIEPWLGALPVWLHVEHGLCSRRPDGTWLRTELQRPERLDAARALMTRHAAQLRGALVETKTASLAFHYRRANPYTAHETLSVLRAELTGLLGSDFELLDGHKVLELRLRGVNKRLAVELALTEAPPGALTLAAGDDRTDEDMFAALPDTAISIRVGRGTSRAKLHLDSPQELRALLARLA